ncbi:hypothetical protein AMTRI_Chr12g241680 [Amborella trichopoda]
MARTSFFSRTRDRGGRDGRSVNLWTPNPSPRWILDGKLILSMHIFLATFERAFKETSPKIPRDKQIGVPFPCYSTTSVHNSNTGNEKCNNTFCQNHVYMK